MPTSKIDRLNKLFEGHEKPRLPPPSKPQKADRDMAPKNLTTQTPRKIPETAPYLRPTAASPIRTGRDADQISSTDEDDYVAAFRSTPTPKTASKSKPERRRGPKPRTEAGAWGYQEGTNNELRVPVEDIRSGSFQKEASDGQPPRTSSTADFEEGLPMADFCGNSLNGRFCPLLLVAKFPYKYLIDRNDRVSKHFFAQNKFYDRPWDIYYVDPLGLLPTKPLILLPLDQVQKLVNDINRAFKSNVKVPEDPFTLSFFNNGTPQPKFLGRSHSREEVAAMESCIPQATEDYGEALTGASLDARRSFADFKAMMERALAATKRNKQAIKRKKNEDRLLAQEDWCRQLKRAQRYFGLRPPVNGVPLPESASLWVEQPKPHVKEMKACGLLLDPLDTKEVAPHVFENEVIFISIDIEAYERDHRKITEIGVSTLDTLDLVTRPPGEGGENWISQIRSRHFRILGREHLQNREFCVGYADKFQFGSSEWVGVGEAAEIVDKCFEYPFSVQYKFDGVSAPRAPELGAETFPPNQQGIETPLQKDNDSVGTSDLSPSAGAGRTICPMHEMPTWVDIAPESSLSISPVERPEPKLADATFSVKGVDTHGPTNTAQDCANRVAASRILQANNSAEATSYQDNSSTIPSKSFHTHIVIATALKLNSCEGEASLVQVSPLQRGPQERKIILVGHDIGNDLEYLKQLGSQIFGLGRSTYPRGAMEINVQENGEYALTSNSVNTDSRAKPGKCHILRSILESLDTMVLYRVVVKDTQNQSLGRMMLGLERMAWHLHNAGNDARYTLEAMVAMVIKSRLEEDKEGTTGTEDKVPGKENTQSDWNTEVERRVKEKTTQAEFEVRDECQRWEKATATFATSLPIMEGRGTATQARLEDSEPTFQISAQPEISSPGGYCDTAFSEQPSHE